MNLNQDFTLIGSSERMKDVREHLEKVAHTDYSVLLVGETGVGKEIVARDIHRKSKRDHRAFVTFNCSNLTDEVAGSQLFGHERGSFTGAYNTKIGLFERTNKGTLFLDEIETLKPDVQARFLRFLETGEYERLGGIVELNADVRVISGTNCELYENPCFRRDLYYRLNEFRINIPPLREHPEDIPELAEFYVALLNASNGAKRTLDSTGYDALMRYKFPGNVRELINILKRAHLFAKNCKIDGESVQYAIGELNRPIISGEKDGIRETAAQKAIQVIGNTTENLVLNMTLPWKKDDAYIEFYKTYLAAVFRAANCNLSRTAELMEISHSGVYRLVHKLKYGSPFEFCRENGIVSDRYEYDTRQGEGSQIIAAEWIDMLKKYNGNVAKTARSLGKSPHTLYVNIKRWGYPSIYSFMEAHKIEYVNPRLRKIQT